MNTNYETFDQAVADGWHRAYKYLGAKDVSGPGEFGYIYEVEVNGRRVRSHTVWAKKAANKIGSQDGAFVAMFHDSELQ